MEDWSYSMEQRNKKTLAESFKVPLACGCMFGKVISVMEFLLPDLG
jgi:hypothetical protein